MVQRTDDEDVEPGNGSKTALRAAAAWQDAQRLSDNLMERKRHMSQLRLVRPEDVVRTTHGAGDAYRFLITGDRSNGQYFAMEARVPPDAGPPPHIQTREEEAFYVLSGEVVFYADGRRMVGSTGTFLHVPRGVAHRFKNESTAEARLLIWFGPAGIEEMMEGMAADPDDFLAIGAEHGVEFVR